MEAMTAESSPPIPVVESRRALTSSASADWGSPHVVMSLAAAVLRPAAEFVDVPIAIDAMSSAYWQDQWPVGATPGAYLDGTPGRDLFVNLDAFTSALTAFCNPAGDTSGETVQRAWEVLTCAQRDGSIGSLFWVGFSLEQLASLQNAGDITPLDRDRACTIIPSRRIRYRVHPGRALTSLMDRYRKRFAQGLRAQEEIEAYWNERPLEAFAANERAMVREGLALIAQIGRGDLTPVSGDAPTHASYLTVLWDRRVKIRQKQQTALRRFLAEQAKDPKSVMAKCAIVGRFET